MKPHSEKFLQQRKFFMVFPLLVLPFITLLFWALGGGKDVSAKDNGKSYSGLKIELPKAIFTEANENWNKFDLYEQAKRDSLKFQQAKKNDPYFEVGHLTNSIKEIDLTTDENGLNISLDKKRINIDPNEEMVNKKLEQLYKELDRNTLSHKMPRVNESNQPILANHGDQINSEVDRLEQMMLMLQEGSHSDPEMKQIESVLEKILDIQHPERVEEKINAQSQQQSKKSFPVEKQVKGETITFLSPKIANAVSRYTMSQTQNGFYGLEDEVSGVDQSEGNAIEAIIHDTQELMSGSTVKMRLLSDVYVNGRLISKDQFIYGICNINGERLTIDIESIRTGNSLLPVSLSAYDLDGLEGIYIPGAIARDVAKQSGNQAIRGMEFFSMDPSFEAQATNAGIQATKSLLSKKAKSIKVSVRAGYKILLYDANAN